MNSNSTQRWLARIAMPVAVVLGLNFNMQAQCDITWPGSPNPVQFSIVIDAVSGTAELNHIPVSANGITSSLCGPLNDDKVRFYTSAAKTTFVNPAQPYRIDFDCSDVGLTTTVWVAINDGTSGNMSLNPASESQGVPIKITIVDLTLPTIGPFPLDVTVNSDDDGPGDCKFTNLFINTLQDIAIFGIPAPPVTGNGEYTDNCLDSLTVTYQMSGATVLAETSAEPIGFPHVFLPMYAYDAGWSTFNVGVTTVTYRIYDDLADPLHLSPKVMVSHVTVIDNEPPAITCPANQNLSTDPGLCTAAITNLAATYSDNCTMMAVTWSAAGATPAASAGTGFNNLTATFPTGMTTVTFQAKDAAALTSTCTFTVTVTDNEMPTVSCPMSDTVSASAPLTCNYIAGSELDFTAAGDNCGIASVINNINGTSTLNTEVFTIGVTNIVWTAADAQGNTKTCAFALTVKDDLPPTGPGAGQVFNINVTPGDCSASLTYEYPGLLFYNPDECSPAVMLLEDTAIVNGVKDPNFLLSLPAFDPDCGRTNLICGAGATLQFPVGKTIIPYIWKDQEGNATIEYIEVNVFENVLPSAVCQPAVITLPLNAGGEATLTTAMVDNGSNDNCSGVTLALSQTAFGCTDLPGTHVVTLTVTDAATNTATCTATIDVVDNLPPQVLCPGNKTVTTNAGCTAVNVADIGLSSVLANTVLTPGQCSDNCGVNTISYQLSGATTGSGAGSVPAGQAFNKGVTTVTYTVKDATGNNAVCNFSVSVLDNTPPVWTGTGHAAGDTITVNANLGGCVAMVNWVEPTFTDACTPPITVSRTHIPPTFFVFGATTVTYTVLDGVGNVMTHTFVVNVVDTQAPVAKCKDITVSLDGAGAASVSPPQVDNLSTDNCFFTYTSGTANYDCEDLGPNPYTLQITDGSGNTSTCVSIVTVQDIILPVAHCNSVSPILLDANGSFTLNATTVNNNSTDNTFPQCPLTYDISVGASAFNSSYEFTCADLGNQTLTFRVTDKAGNTATCSQTVLVKDVTPPSITAPANVTVSCDAPTDPVNTGTYSGVSDECDPDPAVIQLADAFVAGSCANSFTIIRKWQATDDSNNTTTVSQSIFVQDVAKPVFSIQDTIVTQTNDPVLCNAPLTLQLTQDSVSDNCTDFASFNITYTIDYPTPSYGFVDVTTPTVGSIIPGGFFPIGSTLVTWRVIDECGNSTTARVTVIVEDTKGPVFQNGYETNCGHAYVLPNTTGTCSNLFTWGRPNAFFGTGHVGDCLNFTVTEDIDNPSVESAVNLTNPFNYSATLQYQIFPSAQFPVGITTVTYTATDAVGNTSVCSFTVEVEDTQTPVLICPPNQNLLATCPTAQISDYTNLVQVSDNCPANVDVAQSIPGGTTLGTIFAPNLPMAGNQFSITMTGDDGYNTATCTFTVTLQDGDAPIPTITPLLDLIDSCGTLIVVAPSATDPCNPGAPIIYGTPSTPVGTFLNTIPPSYQLNPGSYVLTWVYNDGNGNISTQPQNITVLNDVFPPVAICVPNLTVNLNGTTGKVGINPNQLNNGSYDPNMCGPLTFSVSPDTLTCANAGPSPTVVTLTVRDLKGNPATCTTSILVKDVTAPVLSAPPANITIEACDTIPAAAILTSTDACAGTSLITPVQVSTQDTSGGFLKYNYTITRTWTSTDASGNATTATRTITVKDTQKPAFVNAPTMVMVVTDPDHPTCDDTVSINILPYVKDCATGPDLSVTNNKDPGDGGNLSAIFSVGTHTVVFTATDITGNSSTYAVTVVVKDGTSPTAVCINGVSAALQPSGNVVVNVAQFNNNSYDNCTASGSLDLKIQRLDKNPLQTPSNSLIYDCNDADGVTQHPVKLFVKDAAGNMSMCQTYIVIQDNVVPTITLCPDNKTVLCTDALSTQVHGTALATDNCPNNVTVDFDDIAETDTSGQYCYLVKRVWIASDLANNSASCVQTFNIVDTVAPVLSQYPLDITISCSQDLTPPINITATDNCSDTLVVNFVQDTIDIAPGICGKYNYTVSRTRTVVDDCGNTTTHTNKISVVDDEAPSFPGLPDTLVLASANFPANMNCLVPVSLNVTQYVVDCAPIDELVVLNDAPHGNDSLDASGNYAVGTYLIHFTATDPCGNVGEDSVLVQVIDNSKPTAICNNNVVISLGTDGNATIQPDDIDLGSTDNCSIDTMYLDVATFDCGDLGTQPVTLTVVDPYGNSNTCTVNVNVTLGNSPGFTLATTGTPESYFGADDGMATALATGGTGSFTFQWSNSADTSVISNLSPGIYTVSVTDTGTGCFQVDTAVILSGAKLAITAGNSTGSQNSTVQVPVTADNFNDMVGISFSMNVTDNLVGTILGGTSSGVLSNLILTQVGNSLTVFWASPTPVTLPSGTVLFDLNVQLGNAPIGSSSPVTFDNTPAVLSFQQDSASVPVPTMAILTNGSVMIDSLVVDNITIAGLIKTWAGNGTPVPGVTVSLTGSVTSSVVTGVPGTYSFMVPSSSTGTLTPTKSVTSNFSQGINVGDLLAIQNHAAGVITLSNPYQWVAGDVNNNAKVDLPDYLLVQKLILGSVNHYPNGAPDWKFVPSDYVFPTPNPLASPYPQTLTFPCCVDQYDTLTAVRIGDVTGNAPVNNINSDVNNRSGDVFRFRLDDQPVRAGELISVPFKAADFVGRQAYQMTIAFDPNILELTDIQAGVLPNLNTGNFGTTHLADGYLTTLWVGSDPLTLADDEVLFTLTFRALNNTPALSDILHASSEITDAEALNSDGNFIGIEFVWPQVLADTDLDGTAFALYQNQPNPFRNETAIGFRLPQAGRAILRVFGMDGRLVKTVVGNFARGYNSVVFQKYEFGAPGVYWYELESATHSDRKKMILLD